MAKAKLTSQQQLAEYIQKMQNELTMDCMKYWRVLGEGNITPDEAAKILETLTTIGERLRFAKNCCEYIIHRWEEQDETTTQHHN
jgi:hypothetical protein